MGMKKIRSRRGKELVVLQPITQELFDRKGNLKPLSREARKSPDRVLTEKGILLRKAAPESYAGRRAINGMPAADTSAMQTTVDRIVSETPEMPPRGRAEKMIGPGRKFQIGGPWYPLAPIYAEHRTL